MRLPRFSIARIMAIVVIVAIDLGAIRALDGTNTLIGGLMAIGPMPMAGILVLGFPSLVRAVTGRGEIRPFLAGFEVVGWMVLILYTTSVLLFPDCVEAKYDGIEEHLAGLLGLEPMYGPDPTWQLFGISFGMLILLTPQLVPALAGGWLNQRFKITIAIERRRATELETLSRSGGARQVSMDGTNSEPASA